MVDGNLTNYWSGSEARPGLGTTDLGHLALVMNFCLISHLPLFTLFQADFLRVLASAPNTYTTLHVLRATHTHARTQSMQAFLPVRCVSTASFFIPAVKLLLFFHPGCLSTRAGVHIHTPRVADGPSCIPTWTCSSDWPLKLPPPSPTHTSGLSPCPTRTGL